MDCRAAPVAISWPRAYGPFALSLAVSALLWGLLFIVLPPWRVNFPLFDDWAFSRSIFQFARGGGIDYLEWASMPQLGQWLWACPFVWCLGENFLALRLATLTLSWLGLWGFYDLLRQEGLAPSRAAVAVAALAVNPYWFLLQGTFMTDLPALSMGLLALAAYGRAFSGGRTVLLLVASLLAGLGVMTRQNLVAVPLVAAVLLYRRSELRRRPVRLLSIGLPLALAVVTHRWFQGRPDVSAAYPRRPGPVEILLLPYLILHLGGLAALPLTVFGARWRLSRAYLLALCFMVGYAAYWYGYGLLPYGGLFPYWENLITPWGAFRTLMGGQPPPVMSGATRVGLSLAGCVGGAAILLRLRPWLRGERTTGPLVLFAAAQIPLLLVCPYLFDRYLLVLVPAALLVVASGASVTKWMWPAGLTVLVGTAIISVGLAHDWFTWNEARWTLGYRALRTIPLEEIEGGLEWDGWFAPSHRSREQSAHQGPRPRRLRTWFPYITGRYALVHSVSRDSKMLDRESYSLWLPPGRGTMYLVQQPLRGGEPLPAAPPGWTGPTSIGGWSSSREFLGAPDR